MVFRASVFRFKFTKEFKLTNDTNLNSALIANQNNQRIDLRNHNFKTITSLNQN